MFKVSLRPQSRQDYQLNMKTEFQAPGHAREEWDFLGYESWGS